MASYGHNWRKDFCKRCGAERVMEFAPLHLESAVDADHNRIDVTATVEVKTTTTIGDPDYEKHLRETLTGITTED